MAPLAIDERFSAVHTLTDGTPVRLRLLRPDDRERLRAGFERMSPDSRYRRFLSPTPRLSEAMLDYLTRTDGWNHLAVAAERLNPDGTADGVGVARFIRLPDTPEIAEAAVAVVDEIQHRGLGRLLLATLVEAARERGIRQFRCHVLAANQEVQGLLGDLGGYTTLTQADGLCAYDVPVLPPPSGELVDSRLYRLFRMAATGIQVVLRVVGLSPDEGGKAEKRDRA